MKIIQPSYDILSAISFGGFFELQAIENAARTCYKSEGTGKTTGTLTKNLIAKGHEAMLEHSMLSVKFICDRGVSHELVRHRLASFAQESTRYCNYSLDKFGREITVIAPSTIPEKTNAFEAWKAGCEDAEYAYFKMLDEGCTPEQARSVLPNSLKTEIVVTANYREWRHILALRSAKDAHPDIRYLMGKLLADLKNRLPIIFDDIE